MRTLLLLIAASTGLLAQRADVRGTFGAAAFPDNGRHWHVLAGGSARLYVTPKFAIEPEVLYAYRDRFDKDLLFLPNLVYEFGNPDSNRRAVPYLIGGAGLIHGIRPLNSFNEGSASAGAGVKVFLNDRVFIAPEARLGWAPNLRFTVSVGYAFGR